MYDDNFFYNVERSIEVFLDDFSMARTSFDDCLANLEKGHFMVQEGIVLGYQILERALRLIKKK